MIYSGITITRTVYRVERDDGTGPYDTPYLALRHSNTVTHPAPWREGIEMKSKHHCGFKSVEAMRRWFDETDCHDLKRDGYALYPFTVDVCEVLDGRKQLVFTRSKATRGDAIALS